MARDYKHSGKRKSKKATSPPGWVWLTAGFGLGLLSTALVYLYVTQPAAPPATQTARPPAVVQKAAPKQEPTKAAAAQDKAVENKGVRFEFYTLLPESEVVIPEKELEQTAQPGKVQERPPDSYMLQIGSFRKQPEAESLKGELALLGVVAHIQRVEIKGDTWYRVRVGPFDSYDEINRARDRLRANSVNAIPVKVKG